MSPTKDISQLNDLLIGTNYSIAIIIVEEAETIRTLCTSRHAETSNGKSERKSMIEL